MKQKVVISSQGQRKLVEVQLIPAITNTETGERATTAPPPARYWLHQLCRECADEWFLHISMRDS